MCAQSCLNDGRSVEKCERSCSVESLARCRHRPAQWCANWRRIAQKTTEGGPVSHVDEEIASQPACWSRAVALADEPGTVAALPVPGERVAVVGCGTSWFMAMCYAGLREAAGQGETDAFAASEFPAGRHYDRIVAITRSGTTTEILQLLDEVSAPTTALIGDGASPAVGLADHAVLLSFADEQSVVQTRFATSALTLLRASLGADLTRPLSDALTAVD